MSYYPQAGQVQLPFSPQQVQWPFLNITLNNPPFVPQLQTDPQVQQYLPMISAMCAIELQTNAQRNPLRTFMFNRYAQNNFMNPDFSALVATVVDYVILMLMIRRAYPHLDAAVQDSVPKVVEMVCGVGLREFPQLEQFIDPQMANVVRNSMGQFAQIGSEINAFKQRGQWPGMQQQPAMYQGGYQQPYGGNPGMYGGAQHVPPHRAGASQTNTGLFSGAGRNEGSMTRDPGTGRVVRGNDRWNNASGGGEPFGGNEQQSQQEVLRQPYQNRSNNQMQNQQTDTDQPAFLQALETPAEPVLTPIAEATWKPHPAAQIWYLPAYNPTTHELFLKTNPDGSQMPVLKTRSEVLDYERHKLSTVFGAPPRELDLSHSGEVLQRLEKGVQELLEDRPAPAEGEEAYKPTSFVKKEWIAETSESAAWLITNLERLSTAQHNGNPDIYRAYAQIAEPIVSMKDETDVVKNYGSANTFVELREKLNSTVAEVGAELWTECERKITETVNRILKQNLSIPELRIESFVSDLDDLVNYLEDAYGEIVKNAFLKHQKQVIRRAFGTLGEETAKQLSEGLIDAREYEEGKTPKITYLVSDVSLTYLNCRSYELELELAKNTAAAITNSFTPVLHSLVEQLFKEADEAGQFDRHLIRTIDGRIIEATRGYIGSEFYLLTLIK